jgi:hypothetical protein
MYGGMGADRFYAADGYVDLLDGGFGDNVADTVESADNGPTIFDTKVNLP